MNVAKEADRLETVALCLAFAVKQRSPEAGGIVLQACDTHRVLMVRRRPDKHDPKEAYARWEFPGGTLDPGEDVWSGAWREFSEETGVTDLGHYRVLGSWVSPDGVYVGFVLEGGPERAYTLHPDGHEVSEAAWWAPEDLGSPEVRDKVTSTLDRVLPLLRPSKLVKAEQSPPGFHRVTDEVIELYAPRVQRAMARVFPWEGIERAVRSAYRHKTAKASPTPTGATGRLAPRQAMVTGRGSGLPPAQAAAATNAGAPVGAGGAFNVGTALSTAGTLGSVGAALAAGFGVLSSLTRSTWLLDLALLGLYVAGGAAGAKEAAEAAGGELPPWLEVTNAYPTMDPDAAADLAHRVTGDVSRVIHQRGEWVKEITDTQLDRIGRALAEGLREGSPPREVYEKIEQIMHDYGKAVEIAETEFVRAYGVAAMEAYRMNGVEMVAWVALPTACHQCKENAAASPQPASHPRWPNGPLPVHPHERCAVVPA